MKKKEIVIVLIVLVIGIIGLGYNYYSNLGNKYALVIDHNTNEVLLRFNVEEDAYYSFDVPNGKFHVEVKDGKYRAIDVDCPNQICVNYGWMPSLEIYAPIICIPNGITVQIEE